MRTVIKGFLKGFIPKYIPDKLFLGFFSLLSGRLRTGEVREHLQRNKAVWQEKGRAYKEGGFIEYQERMQEICYGRPNNLLSRCLLGGIALCGAVNACEVIAVYNAFVALYGESLPTDFPELLKCFEQRGITLKGFFGTSPNALYRFLKKNGCCVKRLVGRAIKEEALKDMEETYDTYILTVYEDIKDIFAMVHTVNISLAEKSGEECPDAGKSYLVHNAGLQSQSFAALIEAVRATHRGNGRAICILGIKRPNG